MAESRAMQVHSMSYIPVISPTAPRHHQSPNSSPSIPPPRQPKGTPTQASPVSFSSSPGGGIGQSPGHLHSPPATPASGIPKFRSLRNILPFGPKSTPSTSESNLGVSNHRRTASSSPTPIPRPNPKTNFLSFGSRGAMSTAFRNASSSNLPRPKHEDSVISIDSPIPSEKDTHKATQMEVSRGASEDILRLSAIPNQSPISIHGLYQGFDPRHASSPNLLGSKHTSKPRYPIISIDSSTLEAEGHEHDSTQLEAYERASEDTLRSAETPRQPSSPSLYHELEDEQATSLSTRSYPQPRSSPSPKIELGPSGDLSTILESDTSGVSLSKHIPPSDASQDEPEIIDLTKQPLDQDENLGDYLGDLGHDMISMIHADHVDVSASSSSSSKSKPPLPQWRWGQGVSQYRVRSTGQLRDIVPPPGAIRDGSSPSVTPDSDTYSSHAEGVVNQNADDHTENTGNEPISFDLSSLDPDLAALLSPHNMATANEGDPAIIAAVAAVTPPPPLSQSPSPEPTSTPPSDSPLDTDGSRTTADSRPRSMSVILGPQSSPPRKSRPASLALSGSSHATSSARRGSLDHDRLKPPTLAVVTTPADEDQSPGGSNASGLSRPRAWRSYSSSESPELASSSARRRILAPRLITPARSLGGSPSSPSDAHLLMRSTSGTGTSREMLGSVSPEARASSSLSMTASSRRHAQHHTRTSMELSNGFPERTSYARHRKRSSSVSDFSPMTSSAGFPRRQAAEWLGPRTAKAFAAAGLLDFDKDREDSGPGPRFGSFQRAAGERDLGPKSVSGSSSLHAPSRLGFSELSRSGSWGRGLNSSRAMTMAELVSARGESPNTMSSTPTSSSNTRSALSTSTTTSVSFGSPRQHQHQLESMMQTLKEKHTVETEALLNALADSQRTTRVLREENGHLRDQIQDLEDQLGEAMEKLNAAPSPLRARARTPLLVHPKPGSVEVSPKRQRMHSFLPPERDSDLVPEPSRVQVDMEADVTTRLPPQAQSQGSGRPLHHRFSTSSSIFPIVPSNMTLLMQEDGDPGDETGLYLNGTAHSRSTSPPPSPTLVLPEQSRSRHGAYKSVSSVGNISPTTADFSVCMTGSPGSLHLRPEHEMHLGDMISFDLGEDDLDD